jgi:hypothetical protein
MAFPPRFFRSWKHYSPPEKEYQYYFEKTKKIPKKHLLFGRMSAIISKRLFGA